MNNNKKKKQNKKINTQGLALGLLLQASCMAVPVFSMDLLMAVDDVNVDQLQADINVQTNAKWQLKQFVGSNIELAEDVRLQAITNKLPNAAQIPGATIKRWATLGFINKLDGQFNSQQWHDRLPKQIMDDINFRNNVYAVPTQIHRSNWMWINKQNLSDTTGDELAPRTWQTFFELAEKSTERNEPFLLAVKDPSQNTLVFESLVLGLHGAQFYTQTLQEFDYQAIKDERMVNVFEMLAKLRPYLQNPIFETWEAASSSLNAGNGTVLFAGDWVKSYMLNAQGHLSDHVSCEPLPEASATFLYNLNSIVFFKDTGSQDTTDLANLLLTEGMLTDLNLRTGSIPARLDITPWGFDHCGVRAMREFRSAHTLDTLRPSLAAGMAASEDVQRSVYESINEFIQSSDISPVDGAKNLAKAIRISLYRI